VDNEARTRADQLKELQDQFHSASEQNASLQNMIAQLNKDIALAQDEARTTIETKDDELKRLEAVIAGLQADIDHERKLRDEALKRGTPSSAATMQGKIDMLYKELEKQKERRKSGSIAYSAGKGSTPSCSASYSWSVATASQSECASAALESGKNHTLLRSLSVGGASSSPNKPKSILEFPSKTTCLTEARKS